VQNFKQQFNGGLNADDDFELIGEGQYVNAENMRFGTTDEGAIGNVEVIKGTLEIHNPHLPTAGTNEYIGGCEDKENQRIILFMWNSTGLHGIYCYDTTNVYKVLLSSQVEGGLNFSIDKEAYIHSCRVVEGYLVFTDNRNNPRFVNIDAGIKLNHSTYVTEELPYATGININLIKRPPIYRLDATKVYDSGYINNFIKNNAFKFCYRYHYRDNQISVLSTFSTLIPLNGVADAGNAVDVFMPFSEIVTDYVYKIDLCVKDLNTNKISIIKTYTKNNTSDATAIANHNSATTRLGFRFYNDIIFTPINDVDAVTSSDNVPLKTKSIEIARNRLFTFNDLVGYDTPEKTSLSVTLTNTDTGATGSFTGTWKYLTLHANYTDAGIQDTFNFPYLVRDSDPTLLYYFPSVRSSTIWNGGIGSVPSTINISEASQSGVLIAALVSYLKAFYYPTGGGVGSPPWDAGYDNGSTIGGAVTVFLFQPVSVTQFFKSNSSYFVSIAFYDRERRKCGVVKKSVPVKIPIRTYDQTVFTTVLTWALNNTNAVDEIPEWAYWYQAHITKNTTESFFLQARSYEVKYVKKNQDGTYDYTPTAFAIDLYAVAIDVRLVNNYGQGYLYNEGDIINIHKNPTTNYQLQVIGQEGNYVFCQPFDLGTISGTTKVLFEIYTPYKKLLNEPYYETGDMIMVSNPTTSNRSYSILSGQINGDAYSFLRKDKDNLDYITEAMSPNDFYWKNWHTDIGWPNFVDEIGQQQLKEEIRGSDVIISGTKVNGLNKFQPLNSTLLDNNGGEGTKLQLVQKIQQDGTVLLAICANETFSIYLGEQELFDTKGSAFIAKSDNLFGNIRALQGSMGTVHPESVFAYNGLVEWFDKRNGCFVQYSNNGLFPISKNKLVRAANLFSKQILDSQLVIGGNDPYHKEFLFSIPNTSNPPKGYLEDYDNVIYPYDINDGQAKTLVYKYELDKWVGSHRYDATCFIRLGNDLYSTKGGVLYLHNRNTGRLHGRPYNGRFMYAVNPDPGSIKTFYSLALEANRKPLFVHFRTDNPDVQSSDLIPDDFAVKEGIYTAPIFRDRLDPNEEGSYEEKQMKGSRLFGKYLLVMAEIEAGGAIKFSNVSHRINEGHFLTR
jgi:hypothetical protein